MISWIHHREAGDRLLIAELLGCCFRFFRDFAAFGGSAVPVRSVGAILWGFAVLFSFNLAGFVGVSGCAMSVPASEDASAAAIEQLYRFGESLNESKDKSKVCVCVCALPLLLH